jgi:hypothetical protein
MPKMTNPHIIEITKEITIAKLSSSSLTLNNESGAAVANFMQQIYDKITELNDKDS